MIKKILPLLLLAISILFAIGCGKIVSISSRLADSANTSISSSGSKEGVYTYNHPGFLRDKAAITKAVDELKKMDKFAGKKIMVFQNLSVHDDGRILMEIQDPAKPENIDHYEYSEGKWEAPEPVKISGKGEMADNLTPLDDIAITAVPEMMKITDEKAKTIEGGKAKPYLSFLFSVTSGDSRWLTSLEGTREEYSCDFNKDGSLRKCEKS